MNSHAEYRRHVHHDGQRAIDPVAQVAAAHDQDAPDSALAHHRDPSLMRDPGAQPSPAAGVAWVRPTDLAAHTAPLIGRGIDLQAELIRRARRTPASATRALPGLLAHPTRTTSPGTSTTSPTSPTATRSNRKPAPSPAPLSVAYTEGLSL